MGVHTVRAHPETCQVTTYQRGKTVWVATGDFRGEPLQVKARTETGAVRVWIEVAESRYRCS